MDLHENMYHESCASDNILLLIICFCNDEIVEPARVVVIRINGDVIVILVAPYNGL